MIARLSFLPCDTKHDNKRVANFYACTTFCLILNTCKYRSVKLYSFTVYIHMYNVLYKNHWTELYYEYVGNCEFVEYTKQIHVRIFDADGLGHSNKD